MYRYYKTDNTNIYYETTVSTGGGAALLFLPSPELITNRNSIIFDFCHFTQNEAFQAGGVAVLSTSVTSNQSLSLNLTTLKETLVRWGLLSTFSNGSLFKV